MIWGSRISIEKIWRQKLLSVFFLMLRWIRQTEVTDTTQGCRSRGRGGWGFTVHASPLILAVQPYSIQGTHIMRTPPHFYQIFRPTSWLLRTVQCQEIAVHEEKKKVRKGNTASDKVIVYKLRGELFLWNRICDFRWFCACRQIWKFL